MLARMSGQEPKHDLIDFGAIAFGRYEPGKKTDLVGCEVKQRQNPDGSTRPGEFEISLPPGTGPHQIEVQLLGSEPRRYHLEKIDPTTHELRTFSQHDTPTMMEDTGFEFLVSLDSRR